MAILRIGFLAIMMLASLATVVLAWLSLSVPRPQEPAVFSMVDDKERTAYLKNASEGQIKEIEAFGKNILAVEPLNRAAVEALAIARGLQKDEPAAEKLMLAAANLSFRNSSIQFNAMVRLLARKDYVKALYHADGLLRAHPKAGEFVFPIFAQLIGDKQFLDELTKTLEAEPAWRGPFQNFLLLQGGGPEISYALISNLQRKKLPVTELELRNLIAHFIEKKNHASAYYVWLDSLTNRELNSVKAVFDGEFDLEPRFHYFDWTIASMPNSRIRVIQRPGSQLDRNLSIDFYSETRHFANVRQFLRLSPGSYKMTYEAMAKDIKTDGGLVWKVRCVEVSSDIGKSKTHKESGPWAFYAFNFIVPETGCETQLLTFETESNAVLDAKISGQLNLDKVTIEENG